MAEQVPGKLLMIVGDRGVPTDATIAHLIRYGQWALDDAAHELPAGRLSDERLEELGIGLEQLSRVILQRARMGAASNDPHVRSGVEHGTQTTAVDGVEICDICGKPA